MGRVVQSRAARSISRRPALALAALASALPANISPTSARRSPNAAGSHWHPQATGSGKEAGTAASDMPLMRMRRARMGKRKFRLACEARLPEEDAKVTFKLMTFLLMRRLRASRPMLRNAVLRQLHRSSAEHELAHLLDHTEAFRHAEEAAASIIAERLAADSAHLERLLSREFQRDDPRVQVTLSLDVAEEVRPAPPEHRTLSAIAGSRSASAASAKATRAA
jgi:hypothetical protein